MAKFTTKKKQIAVAEALVDMHVLARAIRQRSAIVRENLNLIDNPDDVKAVKELLQKCNFFSNRMDFLYSTDRKASMFLKEEAGESGIEELSLQCLDHVSELTKKFKLE